MGLPDTLEIENAALNAWPGLEVERDGGWVLRVAGGYTRRANSVQCHDREDDGDAPARLVAARRWFEQRGVPAVFRVTPLAGPGIPTALASGGWTRLDRSFVVAMVLDRAEADPRARLLPPGGDEFLSVQQQLQGYSDATRSKLAAVIGAVAVRACGIVVSDPEGRPAAAALMTIADGIVTTGNVITAASKRGRGYGSALMRSGLAWARDAGARVAAHPVAAENAPAIALYERLGFIRQYDYHYWLAGNS